jgi:hypothetical protein
MFVCLTLWLPLSILGEEYPHPSGWLPSDAVIYLEFPSLKPIVDFVLEPETQLKAKQVPQIAEFLQSPQFAQISAIVRYLELRLGRDWKTLLEELFGGRLVLTAFPREGVVAVLDTQSAELLERLHQLILEHAREEARKLGDPGRVISRSYKDVTAWTPDGGKTIYVLLGRRLILSNRGELLRNMADIRERGGAGSLAEKESFRKAREAIPAEGLAWVFVDVAATRGAQPDGRWVRPVRSNPLLALLAADNLEALGSATWLAGALKISEGQVALEIRSDGQLPSGDRPTSFSLPNAQAGCLPNIEVPRRLVALTLYRDLAKFYSAKDELFPERTSGLIFFENMMGIFFTGRHFSEEVLPHLHPEIRLVVAAQEYDPKYGVPDVPIPAMAIVFRMKDPEIFTPMAEEAWQKALGLINFTRGQQALPGLILDRAEYQGIRYFVAAFPTTSLSEEERRHIRFNFKPALARYEEHLILSTTEQLARDIIDYLRRDSTAEHGRLAGRSLALETSREGILRLLEANRESLIMQNMVEKGHDRKQAEQEVGGLFLLTRLLGQLKAEMGRTENSPWLRLELGLPF